MASDWLSALGLGLALILVTAPFWAVPHAGETATTYSLEPVDYEPGLDGHIDANGPIDGLDCYGVDTSRGCLFAGYVVRNGPVTLTPGSLAFVETDSAEYVAADARPSFYRRNVTVLSDPDTDERVRVRYDLQPVAPETVLADVANPRAALPQPLGSLNPGDSVTVHGRSLDAGGKLVETETGYALLVRRKTIEPMVSRWQALVLRSGAFVLGLGMLRARWRG